MVHNVRTRHVWLCWDAVSYMIFAAFQKKKKTYCVWSICPPPPEPNENPIILLVWNIIYLIDTDKRVIKFNYHKLLPTLFKTIKYTKITDKKKKFLADEESGGGEYLLTSIVTSYLFWYFKLCAFILWHFVRGLANHNAPARHPTYNIDFARIGIYSPPPRHSSLFNFTFSTSIGDIRTCSCRTILQNELE